MVIKNSEMKTQVRHELKGGNGDIWSYVKI